jgi:putative nucleotidyltransferase with HDIG domain
MNETSLARIRQWFSTYTDTFRDAGGRLVPMLQLKLDHSHRVAENARGIAADLGWSPEDLRTAEAVGLLHDVGRFSQLHKFKTLSDRHSINHAEHSAEMVEQHGVLAELNPERRRQILDAVRHHNRIEIPADLPASSVPFARLIRDADKLDIFWIFHDAVVSGRISEHPEMLVGMRKDGTPNPELVGIIRQRRQGPYSMVRSLTDFELLQVSWVYEIHYPPTLARIAERQVLEKLAALLPATPDVREVLETARQHVAARRG